MEEKRQDTMRFTFKFPWDDEATEYDLAALRRVPNQDFPLVRRLTAEELRKVLALPEVLKKMAPNAAAFNRLREFAAIAILHGKLEGDHYTIHRNLVDNVGAVLTELGFDFTRHKELRKEGDKIVAQEPKPETVSQLAQRVAELQAIVDKRDDRQWDPIVELFHPDMNVSDIKLAIERLLEVQAVAKCAEFDETVLGAAASCCEEALWVGRKTQLENDEPAPAEHSLSEAIKCANRRGATAEILWDMLDNIDTLSDQLKPGDEHGYKAFYQKVMSIAAGRHEVLRSNGHTLMWPDDDSVERIHGRYQDLAEAVESASIGAVWHCKFPEHEWLVKGVSDGFRQAHEATRAPVPMLLHCPMCHARHIDEGEFATKVHHTHACQGFVKQENGKRIRCGHVWRPAIVATVGVEALPGFVNP